MLIKHRGCAAFLSPLSLAFLPPHFVLHIPPATAKESAGVLKGELYLDNKWQSDDLFYIIMNEIHPHFNQF